VLCDLGPYVEDLQFGGSHSNKSALHQKKVLNVPVSCSELSRKSVAYVSDASIVSEPGLDPIFIEVR
jgi:hypothetical protein